MILPRKKSTLLLIMMALFSAAFFWLVPPIPQWPGYHQFADQRQLLGIPHFWNVLSNLPFVVIGALGVRDLRRNRLTVDTTPGYPAAQLFFIGVLLTGFGSAWYHLAPTNATLVWDRLPMTISFMPLFVILLSEYLSPGIEKKLLYPLLALGLGSVIYWHYTELQGRGDLRWYALVQFLPLMLMVPLVLLANSRYSHGHGYLWMLAFYLLAKITEYYDGAIYEAWNRQMSGHAIKHLLAAAAAVAFWLMLRRRNYRATS